MFISNIKNQLQRPKKTNFSQQCYTGITVTITPKTVFPVMLVFMILNLILIFRMATTDTKLFIYKKDYTKCMSMENKSLTCATVLRNKISKECTCVIQIVVDTNIRLPVYLSYQIIGFYQSFKNFRESFDALQLNGNIKEIPSKKCGMWSINNLSWVLPCGAKAFTNFNDTFKLNSKNESLRYELLYIPLIASEHKKFRLPKLSEGETLSSVYDRFSSPMSWSKNLSQLEPNRSEYNGVINPDFVNWMLSSPFNFFTKPYRVISGQQFLYTGNYTLVINYRYGVESINARKIFVLSQSSFFGSKNMFMLTSSIASAAVCFVIVIFGILDYILHLNC